MSFILSFSILRSISLTAEIQAAADHLEESLNDFIIKAIDERMERLEGKKIITTRWTGGYDFFLLYQISKSYSS